MATMAVFITKIADATVFGHFHDRVVYGRRLEVRPDRLRQGDVGRSDGESQKQRSGSTSPVE
jgi:hypothetical protein